MKKSIFDDDDPYLEAVRKRRGRTNTTQRRKRHKIPTGETPNARLNEFMKQDIDKDMFWFIPDEYFGITLFVLFLTLPKLIGMGFFFFYVAGGDSDLYSKIHTGGYLLDWIIGYEILAAIILLWIFKQLISYVFGK